MRRKRYFFVEPIGIFSNKIIANALEKITKEPHDNSEINDVSGKKRVVWEIPKNFIAHLIKSKQEEEGLNFNLFSRLGENGPIEKYKPKNLKNDPKITDAKKWLKKLVEKNKKRSAI